MLEDKLFSIIAELLNVPIEKISISTKAEEIESWDSLAVLNIALAVESEFGVPLTPETVSEFYSIKIIYDTIRKETS